MSSLEKEEFFIKIEKEQGNWILLITSNRCIEFNPFIITKIDIKQEHLPLLYKLKISLNYKNYLNIFNNVNEIKEKSCLQFYFFQNSKDKKRSNFQPKSCKEYFLLDLLSTKQKVINFGTDLRIRIINSSNNTKQLTVKQKINLKKNIKRKQNYKIIRQLSSYGDFNPTMSLSQSVTTNPISFDTAYRLYGIDKENYKTYFIMFNYKKAIDQKLERIFKPKRHETCHIIYYDLNAFKDMPVISALFMDPRFERSNEKFWLKILKICKELCTNVQGDIKFDYKESWVNMLTLIPCLSHNYILENVDVYMESWFTRLLDCEDSGIMIIQLYKLFINGTYKNEELQKLQYWAKKYIHGFQFWYVRSPSASTILSNEGYGVKAGNEGPIGHFFAKFISKYYFIKHCIRNDKDFPEYILNKMMEEVKEEDKNLNNLFAEGTAFIYPSLKRLGYQVRVPIGNERNMKFLENSNFYVKENSMYTTYLLDKFGINQIAFYCGIKNKNGYEYGIPFKHTLAHQRINKSEIIKYSSQWEYFTKLDKQIVFIPFPLMTNEFIKYAKECANSRMYLPNFLILGNSKFKSCFVSTEKIDKKQIEIEKFLNNSFTNSKGEKIHKSHVILSLDDLYDDKNTILQLTKFIKTNNFKIKYKKYEVMYNTFFYVIKFFIE